MCKMCKQSNGTLAHMSARQTMPPSRHRAGLNSSRFSATGRLEGWLMLRKLFSKSGTKKYLQILKFGSQGSQIYTYGKNHLSYQGQHTDSIRYLLSIILLQSRMATDYRVQPPPPNQKKKKRPCFGGGGGKKGEIVWVVIYLE